MADTIFNFILTEPFCADILYYVQRGRPCLARTKAANKNWISYARIFMESTSKSSELYCLEPLIWIISARSQKGKGKMDTNFRIKYIFYTNEDQIQMDDTKKKGNSYLIRCINIYREYNKMAGVTSLTIWHLWSAKILPISVFS